MKRIGLVVMWLAALPAFAGADKAPVVSLPALSGAEGSKPNIIFIRPPLSPACRPVPKP